jgi:RHS repeat-associated protein
VNHPRFEIKEMRTMKTLIYDAIDRLTDYRVGTLVGQTIPSPISESVYNLDAVGNWNSKVKDGVTESRTHNAANEITAINSGAVAHDNNGNLTASSTKTYAYDEGNRLVSASSGSSVVGEYIYDALGRRVIKRASPTGTVVETRYLHDGARIIEEQDTTGATLATYVYGNYVDEVLQMVRAAGASYYHQNALWHVLAVTDSAGQPAERYSFDAYGYINITDGSGTVMLTNSWGTAHSAIGNPWTYTGRQFDEETGLYHYRARTYDPIKGRFLSRDPLGYIDGLNLYEYVRNNPTGALDPWGETSLEIHKSKITPGTCGMFQSYAEFPLPKGGANGDWLIQYTEVEIYRTKAGTVTGTILPNGEIKCTCSNCKSIDHPVRVVNEKFYEAFQYNWRPETGKINVRDANNEKLDGNCYAGNGTIKKTIAYYGRLKENADHCPEGFHHKTGFANCYSDKPPEGWSTKAADAIHWGTKWNWDCCPTMDSPTNVEWN